MLLVFINLLFNLTACLSNYVSSFEGEYHFKFGQLLKIGKVEMHLILYVLSMDSNNQYQLIPINSSTDNILNNENY